MTALEQEQSHTSVMPREVIEAIAPRAGQVYVDVTLGAGGHSEALLEASAPDGRVFGIDQDPVALDLARQRLGRFGDRLVLNQANFDAVGEVLRAHDTAQVDGLVADLGVSSMQLDAAERGFSFRYEGPLDMRMDPTQGETARALIERLDEQALADVLFRFGEERRSRAVARSIKRALAEDALETTGDLRRAVGRVVGRGKGRIDPATRSFQALRIAVNREIEALEALLRQLPDLLADRAVAVIISFHSLEDRLVKRAFRGDDRLAPLTKRPLVADEVERASNPRSRSAKLRAARRLPREARA